MHKLANVPSGEHNPAMHAACWALPTIVNVLTAHRMHDHLDVFKQHPGCDVSCAGSCGTAVTTAE